MTLSEDIVKTCCVLHNFVMDRDGYNVEDTLSVEGTFDMEPVSASARIPTSQESKHVEGQICGILFQ